MTQTTHLLIGIDRYARCRESRADLPPVSAYDDWAKSRVTGNNGGKRAYTGRQLRQISVLKRQCEPGCIISRAVRICESSVSKLWSEMPEALK